MCLIENYLDEIATVSNVCIQMGATNNQLMTCYELK